MKFANNTTGASYCSAKNKLSLAFLYFALCTFCLTGLPNIAVGRPSASDDSAKSRSTLPFSVLDEGSAAALIGELSDDLRGRIDNKNTVATITEKWKARNLVGK